MSARRRYLFAAVLLPLTLGACTSSGNTPAPGAAAPPECRTAGWRERIASALAPAPGVMPVTADSVRYLDTGLERAVIVRSLSARRAADDGVAVYVHFLNCTDQRIALGARVTFLDAAQRPLGLPSAWQPLHLQPRSTALYSERTLAETDVKHFFVEVRDGGGGQ